MPTAAHFIYIPAVLRNMWVYEALAGTPRKSLKDIAQNRWPSFPMKTR